jgi:superfamily II DNA/RNA helicase
VDVKRIIAQLPPKRQTLFFSATMPAEVESLAMSILHDPASVKVDPVSSTVDAIRQTLYMVDKNNKKFLLADLLKKPEVENALVFTRTKHGADKVVEELERMGVPAMAIHGNKSQNARQAAMGQFKGGHLRVLIATDIAARGIDVVGLSHVINYDQPDEPEAYIHRIGRTGRAGLGGDAISFCCIDEMKQLAAVEKLIGFKIPRKESAWPMLVFTESVKQPRMPRPARVRDVNLRGEAVTARLPEHRAHRSAPVQGSRGTPMQGSRGTPVQSSRGTPVQSSRAPLSSRAPQGFGSHVTPTQEAQNSYSTREQGSDNRNASPTQGTVSHIAPLRGTRLHAEPQRSATTHVSPGTRQQQPTAQSRMDTPRFGPRPQAAVNRAPEAEHEYAQPRQTAQSSQQAPQAEQRKKRIKFESR